jgi:hypothetical protein
MLAKGEGNLSDNLVFLLLYKALHRRVLVLLLPELFFGFVYLAIGLYLLSSFLV